MRPSLAALLLLPALPGVCHTVGLAQTGPLPFSCADTVQAALGSFRGEWQVQALFRSSTGTWNTTQAVATIAPDLVQATFRRRAP